MAGLTGPDWLAAHPILGIWEVVRQALQWSDWTTRHMLEWTGNLFARQGYLVTFLGVLLENTLFFGFLVPGVLVLVVAGMAAQNGDVSLTLVAGTALAGALIGDTVSYLSGRYVWSRALGETLVRAAERLREPLQRNSSWLILSYHFAGYSRVVGPTAAGLFRLPFRRWALFDYVGVTVWVAVYLVAGYLLATFGIDLEAAKRNVRIVDLVLLAMAVVVIGTLLRRMSRRRQRPAPVRRAEPEDEKVRP